ncbi:MAG: phosphodiester glycosidase family protein [Verrucomicrobia bacterium]|nr:phosphodiester glycosidase family protein [Verrucomicrobiota bacterium]
MSRPSRVYQRHLALLSARSMRFRELLIEHASVPECRGIGASAWRSATQSPRPRDPETPIRNSSCNPWLLWCRLVCAALSLTASLVTVVAAPAEAGRGYTYKNDQGRNLSVHVLQVDRKRADLELVTTLSQNQILGLGPLTEQIRTIHPGRGRPLAAINGDFFSERGPYPGDPRGLQIMEGELVSAPDADACFWIDTNKQPRIGVALSQLKVLWPSGSSTPLGLNEDRRLNGAVLYTPRFGSSTYASGGRELVLERDGQSPWLPLRAGLTYSARVREIRETGNTRLSRDIMVISLAPHIAARIQVPAVGSTLRLSMATTPDLKGVQTALGGGPQLVRAGEVQSISQSFFDHRSHQRHPRTAIGWNSKYFFLVAVDGRQPGLSMGMSLPELAAYMARQGCEEALNLDGGGSVEFWLEGNILNSPCYGYERPTANALVLVQTEKEKGQGQ